MPDHPDISRVLVTGYADTDAVVDAINKGQVYRFVSKPWNEEELRSVIRSGYELNRSRVQSAARGTEVLSMLDGVTGELDRLSGILASGGADSLSTVEEGLRSLRSSVAEQRERYSRTINKARKP